VRQRFNYLLDLKNDSCAWVGRPAQDLVYFSNSSSACDRSLAAGHAYPRARFGTGRLADEWTVIPFPGSASQVVATGGTAYAVLHNDPAQDLAAWLFIRWLRNLRSK